jgi:hypothetical protein
VQIAQKYKRKNIERKLIRVRKMLAQLALKRQEVIIAKLKVRNNEKKMKR